MKDKIDELEEIHKRPTCRSCGRPEGTNETCDECQSMSGKEA